MPKGRLSEFVRCLRAASGPGTEGVADGELLERYVRRKDESAFETLMRRHGPMVMGVCLRILGRAHDAEDAFQATFLVLVRKAATIRPRGQVGNWLHGVARRTALLARRLDARRRIREANAAMRAQTPEDVWMDWRPLLDQEISRLPDKQRAVLILCDLEGQGRREAADRLGVPEGTVASRLARARAALAKRLARRGIAGAGGALVPPQNGASAGVPAALLASTIRAAALVAGRNAAAGVISAKVVALMQGVMKTMLLSKIKSTAVVLALSAACLLGVGVGAWAYRAPAPAEKVAPGQGSYAFAPVNKDWIKRTAWLKCGDSDPGIGGGSGVDVGEAPERDPDFKDYHREDRYFVRDGDQSPCKILQYYPSGAVEEEIDQLNAEDKLHEQFCRCFYPDGSPASFVHWKEGKVLDAASVSRDGRVTHRVKDGDGELIAYARKGDNHADSWYSQGFPYLEKHYRDGACVQIRLNDGEDCLFARPSEEELVLTSRHESWRRRAGAEAQFQRTDLPWVGNDHGEGALEAAKMRGQYPQRRADFVKGYGERLAKAGKTWEDMKIDFIRIEGAWPE